MRIFDEFDKDRDGHLNAKELSAALRSRKVEISEEQVQEFIEGESPSRPLPKHIGSSDSAVAKTRSRATRASLRYSARTWWPSSRWGLLHGVPMHRQPLLLTLLLWWLADGHRRATKEPCALGSGGALGLMTIKRHLSGDTPVWRSSRLAGGCFPHSLIHSFDFGPLVSCS